MKLDFLFKKDYLAAGVDSGNITNKITYADQKGNIQSINLASIIGVNAETTAPDLGESDTKAKSFADEMMLHVQIKSPALPKNRSNAYYTVGEYAQIATTNPANLKQTNSKAEDKLGEEIHVVTTLTGLALAAWKSGKGPKIKLSLSFGLPIEEAKEATVDDINIYKGIHDITAIDGPFKGKTITIDITEVQLNVEGVTSYLALAFDLKNGEVVETDYAQELGEEFGIADLGAGTLDLALYDENGLNPHKSTNHSIGTNAYIDDIMEEVMLHEVFENVRKRYERAGKTPKITSTREEFMRKFIKPEIEKSLANLKYTPKFEAVWQSKTVDITDIVNKHTLAYSEEVKDQINNFFVDTNIGKMLIVGGGLLFAYRYLQDLKEEDCYFPPNLQESSFFTSKAYLLKNIIVELEKQSVEA
jgi:plasmid segregation protein ParM